MKEKKGSIQFVKFESKVRDSEFINSKLVSFKNIKVEMTTLYEFAAPNLKIQPLSILVMHYTDHLN